MADTYAIQAVLVSAGVILLTRFLPFLILNGKQTPERITWLGKVLPYAIMGMLVGYCLRGVSFESPGTFLPEGIAVLTVILVHIRKRNSLLSITAGTAVYMLMIHLI